MVGLSVTGVRSYKSVTSGNKQSRNAMSGFKSSAVHLYWVSPLECVVSDLSGYERACAVSYTVIITAREIALDLVQRRHGSAPSAMSIFGNALGFVF